MRGSGQQTKSSIEQASIDNRGPQLLIMIGMPGSGKSTWAKQQQGYKLISTDAIRLQLRNSLSEANDPQQQAGNNELVFTNWYLQIRQTLSSGDNVIADATNLYASARQQLLQIAKETGAQARAIVFSDKSRARTQNKKRVEDAVVPDQVMDQMEAKLLESIQALEGAEKEAYASITRVG